MLEYLKDIFRFNSDYPGVMLVIAALYFGLRGCKKTPSGNWEINQPLAPFFFLSAIFGLICDFSLRVSSTLSSIFVKMGIDTLYSIPVFWFIFGLCFLLLAFIPRNFINTFLHPAQFFIKAGFSWKNVGDFLDSDIKIEKGKVIVNGTPWQVETSPHVLLGKMGHQIVILSLLQPFGIRVAEQLGVSIFCSWPSFFLFFLPLIKCLFYTIPFMVLSFYLVVASPYLLLSGSKLRSK